MDPLTIILIGGVAVLAFLGLRHSGPYIPPTQLPYNSFQQGSQYQSTPGITGQIENSAFGGLDTLAQAVPIPGVGEAISAIGGIVQGLLAAHQMRLQDATTENSRVAAAVPSFYNTITAIINAYNSGQISKTTAIASLNQLDQMTYTSLRQFVGKPGTAWNANTPGICDKTCTVGCCIYNTYLRPDIQGWPIGNYVGATAGGPKGLIPMLQHGAGGTKGLAGIPTNTYNFPGYPGFSLTLKAG
jgi:hypothetical protein